MPASIPAGSSLQALPVAPSINPVLGVAAVDPLSSISQGIDFAGQFARLGQLKDKLALEDLQRKADAAKAKAAETEADLIHKNLATQYAAKALADQNALLQQQTLGAQLGALRDVVVGTPETAITAAVPGTAVTDANTAAIQSKTNNVLAQSYQDLIAGTLSSGTPVSPAKLAATVANAPLPVSQVASNDSYYEPNASLSLDDYLAGVKQQLAMRKLLNKEAPVVTIKEVQDAAGLSTKPETYIGKDNREYSVDVTYGPGGLRFARSTPVPKNISPERAAELSRTPELADTNQALQVVQDAIDEVTKYQKENGDGSLQAAGLALATTKPEGLIASSKRLAGQSMLSPGTKAAASKLDALQGLFNSAQRSAEIRGFAAALPVAVDLANPDNALAKLNAVKTNLQAISANLSSKNASNAVTAAAGKPAAISGEIRVNPATGAKYRYDAASHSWIPL